MRSNSFFKKHPKLSLLIFNIILLLFIFLIFEIVLRIFTPNWLEYKMKMLNSGLFKGYGTDANWDIKYNNGQFYSFTPNSTFKIYHYEYENTVHINNLGGRSTVPDEIADTSELIPFTGDSFIMGVGVEDTETVVSLVKKRMQHNFINLGIGGTAMHVQRKMIASRYNEFGRPKTVVYGFWTGNDFDDIVKENAKETDSTSTPENKSVNNEPLPEHGFWWKLNYFINHNKVLNKLYCIQFIKQKLLNVKNKKAATAQIDPFFLIINSKNTNYINEVKKHLDREVQLLANEPYEPIIIIMPDKYQIFSELRKNMLAYYNLDEKNIDPSLPNKILKEILEKYRIKYIDATDCLSNNPQKEQLYYIQDNHFTKYGQLVLADCISDSLDTYIKTAGKK